MPSEIHRRRWLNCRQCHISNHVFLSSDGFCTIECQTGYYAGHPEARRDILWVE